VNKRYPHPLQNCLDNFKKSFGDLDKLSKINDNWKNLIGLELFQECKPLNIEKKILTIAVNHPQWRQALIYNKHKLKERIEKIGITLNEIKIIQNYEIKNKNIKSFLDFFSRVSISAIFISAIPGKINGFERTVEYISSKGIPETISSILLVGAIICLILGSGFFIFGEKQKIGSVFLLLFLIPTTIIFHVFPFHQRAVFMNLALIGGLIISAIREPK